MQQNSFLINDFLMDFIGNNSIDRMKIFIRCSPKQIKSLQSSIEHNLKQIIHS